MLRFLARRFGLTLLTLFLVSVIVFASAQVLPGDIGRTILGQFSTPEQVAALDHKLGADRPLGERYVVWFGNFVRGDWGDSYLQNVPAAGLVFGRFVNSMYLGLFALLLTV